MFEKNDKFLIIARIIIYVFIGIFAVASLVMGIALAVALENGIYFLLAFAGWFLSALLLVFSQLFLSYMCDVKLIRNKLYGENNTNLEVFFRAENEMSDSPEMQEKLAKVEAELTHLQQLLSSGVITTEEYENRKKELTGEK